MKEQLKVTIMIVLCLLMQVISVLPHHHHDDLPCLNQMKQTGTNTQHKHSCDSDCITKFNLESPSSITKKEVKQNSVKQNHFFEASLICETNNYEIDKKQQSNPYSVKLYCSHFVQFCGLRAPPQLSL